MTVRRGQHPPGPSRRHCGLRRAWQVSCPTAHNSLCHPLPAGQRRGTQHGHRLSAAAAPQSAMGQPEQHHPLTGMPGTATTARLSSSPPPGPAAPLASIRDLFRGRPLRRPRVPHPPRPRPQPKFGCHGHPDRKRDGGSPTSAAYCAPRAAHRRSNAVLPPFATALILGAVEALKRRSCHDVPPGWCVWWRRARGHDGRNARKVRRTRRPAGGHTLSAGDQPGRRRCHRGGRRSGRPKEKQSP